MAGEAGSALAIGTHRIGAYAFDIPTGVGPRILAFRRVGEESPFADLPGAVIDHPDVGRFRFHGGHRLWRAPEVPAITYHPDDVPVEVIGGDGHVEVADRGDLDGLVRRIVLTPEDDRVLVTHTFANTVPRPIELAPWAITQLRIGGTAFLPIDAGTADPDGVLPNRTLVLWPYTDLSSPDVAFSADRVAITASDRRTPLKLGTRNTRGWLAYRFGDQLFVKWAPVHDDALRYVDHGATVQCYRDHRFIELETLGPLVSLEPGDVLTHTEVWAIMDIRDDLASTLAAIASMEGP